MSLPVSCVCGKTANVPDAYAGRDVKCPDCGKTITVSAPKNNLAQAAVVPNSITAPKLEPSYSRNDGLYEIDYKKNKRYFAWKMPVITAITLIIVGPCLISVANPIIRVSSIIARLILSAICIIPSILGIVSLVRRLSALSDKDIDEVGPSYLKDRLEPMALDLLNIDEEEIQISPPIRFVNYFYDDISPYSGWKPKTDWRVKEGKDKELRSSHYNGVIIYFSAERIHCYQFKFSLIDSERKEEIAEEYFYGDIVSIAISAKNVAGRAIKSKQLVRAEFINWQLGPFIIVMKLMFIVMKLIFYIPGVIIKWLLGIHTIKTHPVTEFTLTTSGGTVFTAEILRTEECVRAVKAMRSLLREKKKELHSNEVYAKSGG
ncbi:hypothetical protein FACS1894139_08860 [Planctomycetales bacterium]|nr:hypothetical protein FACS1894107_14810 [Planctomycetales bacterium]GHS98185.1 hypothetical protein FACS1894108_05890 [Planctomycetales bacterium]GHT05298.1 hypothetical protein FACS1894139_08860 [Planctomycetales bacterium]